MDISLIQGSTGLALNGMGAAAPFRAARFADEALTRLEIVMEDGPAALNAGVSTLSGWMFEAGRTAGDASQEQVYLRVTLADGSAWRTPLRGGEVTAVRGPAGRQVNAQAVRVEVLRADWWESADPAALTLTNAHGSGETALIYNHADGGHANYADLSPVSGDLPAPLDASLLMGSYTNVEAFVGIGSYVDFTAASMVYEGGAGVTGAGVTPSISTDAGDSNNSYVGLAWSGTGLVTLQYWSPTQAQVSAYGARFFRPLVRLHGLIGAAERFWLQMKLAYNSGGVLETVYGTEPVLVPTDRVLFPLPVVQLPPWATLNRDSQPVALALTAWAETAGAHTLQLDYLGLIPMDAYLHLIPKITTYPDFNIQFLTESGLVKNNGRSMGTHVAEGSGLWAAPGRANRLFLLMRSGATSSVAASTAVSLTYRPRRRRL